VTDTTFRVVDAGDVPTEWGCMRLLRKAAGITAFGINEFVVPPGWDDYQEHDELKTGHVELYFCIDGGGAMTIDGTAVELVPDRYVFVPPACTRNLVAGPHGLRMLAIGVPDAAEYTGWDSM
jgi:hypothetical protein